MAVRCSALSLGASGNAYLEEGDWQIGVAYRYVHSFRHFRGGEEEPQRVEQGTEVINDMHTWDASATYAITPRWTAALTLPTVYNERSSKYEHLGNLPLGNPRYTTRASGIGDLRLTTSYWLGNPDTSPDANLSVGAGVKMPTGDHEATDEFVRPAPGGGTREVTRPVDPSIQPGDGGWGAIVDVNGFQKLADRTFGYVSATYLMNPQDTNGVETPTSRPGNVTVDSVPDGYLVRAGVSFAIWPEQGLALSLGGRLEGTPPKDLIGDSNGFRRPGYMVSIEPGLTWVKGRWTLAVNTPVALVRNRQVSQLDEWRGTHGDAAFPDWYLTTSLNFRF